MSPKSYGHLSSAHPFGFHVDSGAADSEPLLGLLSFLRPSGDADAATLRLGELIVPTEPMVPVPRAPVQWLRALCWGVRHHIAVDKTGL